MLKVAIIIGSTRPGRKAEVVARWVYDIASKRSDAAFEIVDIKDFNLPLLDEPVPAAMGQYSQPHTKAWAAKIEQFDAFVFVTPEYNHGPSAALKNAIDFLHREWNNKAAGFVSYGSMGGVRAVEHLRGVAGAVPTRPCRIFQVQKRRNPLRCQAIAVAGLTMSSAERQSHQTRERKTQNRRSAAVSFGRFPAERFRTPI